MSEQISGEPPQFEPINYKLKRPLQIIENGEFRGNYVRVVTVHSEPNEDDLEAIPEVGMLPILRAMLPRITTLPESFIGKLKVPDVYGLWRVIGPLLEDPGPTDAAPDTPGASSA